MTLLTMRFLCVIIKSDRNRHGGGILMYTHCSLSYKLRYYYKVVHIIWSSCRAISVSTKHVNHTSCICLFYRPPSSPVSIFDNLCTTVQLAHPVKFSSFILLGDFNVNFQNAHHLLFSYINDILLTISLKQVVSSFTHISPNSTNSLIDLVMLSDPFYLHNCTTVPPPSHV